MTKRLPIDERLEVAGQLVTRAKIFYDIWWLYESAETRPKIIGAMNKYSEFFRFDTHAHFVSFIVHIAGLFESRSNTMNLPNLVQELEASQSVPDGTIAEAKALLGQVGTLPSKVAILRSNLFAHRSTSLSYSEAFQKANVTPNQLRDLTEVALQIANCLLTGRGLQEQSFHPLPLNDAEVLLNTLADMHMTS